MANLLPISDGTIGFHWTLGTGGLAAWEHLDEGNAHNGGIDVVTGSNSGSLGGDLPINIDVPSADVNELTLRLFATCNSGDVTVTLYINGSVYGTIDQVIAPDNGGSGVWNELVYTGWWPAGSITSIQVAFKLTNTFSSCVLDSTYIVAIENPLVQRAFAARSMGTAKVFGANRLSSFGLSTIYNAKLRSERGLTRTGFSSYSREDRGLTVYGMAFVVASRGEAATYNTWQGRSVGLARWSYTPYAGRSIGTFLTANTFAAFSVGIHRVSYLPYQAESRGEYLLTNQFTIESRGEYRLQNQFGGSFRGITRIANDSLSRYEVYRGVNAAVSFSSPWQTFTGSSFTLPSLTAGNVYRFVVRKRNAYGLVSENVNEYVLDLDGSGNVRSTKPSPPREILLEQIAGPKVRVTAKYDYQLDGVNAAGQFLIWAKANGANIPGSESPIVVSMVKADGVAKLSTVVPVSGNYSNGDTVHVLVRVRRSGSPSIDSANTDEVTQLITTTTPTTPAGGIFLGGEFEQRQN